MIIMGFDPLEYKLTDYIIKTLPIPPLAIRPLSKGDQGGIVYDNQLSIKLI
jgi:hypothetical protein